MRGCGSSSGTTRDRHRRLARDRARAVPRARRAGAPRLGAARARARGPRGAGGELPAARAEHVVLAADVGRRARGRRARDRALRQAGRRPRPAGRQRRASPTTARSPTSRSSRPRRWSASTCSARSTRSTAGARADARPRPRAPRRRLLGRRAARLPVGRGLRRRPRRFDRGFAEALRHELSGTGVSVTTVFPGEVETALHDHQRDRLPDWRRDDNTIPPERVAEAILAAVEADRRAVHSPAAVTGRSGSTASPRASSTTSSRRVRGQRRPAPGLALRRGSRRRPRRSRRPSRPR